MKTIKARWFDPAVSLSMILESEKKIGYKFPESYIDIVSKYDALTPIEDTFKFINIYMVMEMKEMLISVAIILKVNELTF